MIITKILYFLIPLNIFLVFFWAPSVEILGNLSRIIFFHVPCAWVSVLAFLISGTYSLIFVLDKNKKFTEVEVKSHQAAKLGFIFTILTTVSGSIWAKLSWGSFWNWDPRETSILILLLIFVAYFSLSASLEKKENKAKITSSYLILAMITVPFLIFIIPKAYPTLHPNPILNEKKKIFLDQKIKITLLVSVISFSFLFFSLLSFINKKIKK